MTNAEEHEVVEKSRFGRFGIHAEAPLLLSTVSFFAFPFALLEFTRVNSTGEMLAVGFAIVTWMIATLVGIKRIPDIPIAEQEPARIRVQRACVSQAALLAFGAVLLCLCSRFPAK